MPSTTSAPVRPRSTRSSPSRSSVPGATAANVARSRASGFCLSPVATVSTPPRSVRMVRTQCRGSDWSDQCPSDDLQVGWYAGFAPTWCLRAGCRARSTRGAGRCTRRGSSPRCSAGPPRGRAGRLGISGVGEPEPRCLGQPLTEVGNRPQLAGQSDLADGTRCRSGTGTLAIELATANATARSLDGPRRPSTADGGGVDVAGLHRQTRRGAEHGEQHGEPRVSRCRSPHVAGARHRARCRPAPAPRPAADGGPRGSP